MPRPPGLLGRVLAFHDLPLWAKVLVAPVVCFMAGFAVAASVWLGASEADSRLAEVADRALPTAAASAQMLDAIDTIEARSVRAMVWQQAGVAAATIDALVKEIGEESKALRASTAAMVAQRSPNDVDLPRIKRLPPSRRSMANCLPMHSTSLAIPRSRSAISAAPTGRSSRCAATYPAWRPATGRRRRKPSRPPARVRAPRWSARAGLSASRCLSWECCCRSSLRRSRDRSAH